MQSIQKLLSAATAAFLLVAAAGQPVIAGAQQTVAVTLPATCEVNLTGKISRVVSPREFAMIVDNHNVGSIHVFDNGARMNANGVALQAGTYAGVHGCYGPGQRYFKADEVTLAQSAGAYQNLIHPVRTTPAPVAAQVGPCQVSLFGTVTQVFNNGVEMTLQTQGPIGDIHVYHNGALMHANGLSLTPGVYSGVYGCFMDHMQRFHANEVTLSTSAATYPLRANVVATGTIDDVRPGWIGVLTRYYGHVHVITSQALSFARGQRVSIEGHYNTRTRQIDATRVTVI